MKTQRRKLLAAVVAVSLMASNPVIGERAFPACLPEDPMLSIEDQADKDKGKRKNKKGYFV
ncbi:MAG: hypothetical protein PHG18_05245 [Bacilli bacterium]|nr:hypothetical protein [Bacilli bacterium]